MDLMCYALFRKLSILTEEFLKTSLMHADKEDMPVNPVLKKWLCVNIYKFTFSHPCTKISFYL